MNNIRWVVERRREGDPKVSPLWPGWHIYRLHGGKNGAITDYDQFPTWEMAYARAQEKALAYADQQARTVAVELPPVVGNKCIDPDMSPAIFVEKTPGHYGIFLGHRHKLSVTPEELKPLGEYLLSLHYAKESALNEPR